MTDGVPGSDDDEFYVVKPLYNLVSVLDQFWETYALQRQAGVVPPTAVRTAVTAAVAPEHRAEVLEMLSGQLDGELSILEPFDGQGLCSDLIDQGERVWLAYRELPGWPETRRSEAPATTGAAPGWWKDDKGIWHSPSATRPPPPAPVPSLDALAEPAPAVPPPPPGEPVVDGDVGVSYPRINALLAAHEVSWQTVASRIDELVPLADGNLALGAVFDAEMSRLDEMAATDAASATWFSEHMNRFRTFAMLHQGYGVGRLALGTVASSPGEPGPADGVEVEALTAEIVGLVQSLRLPALIQQSADPSALGPAIDGVSAGRAAELLRDPVERLTVHASRQGFLIAIAEEIAVRGSDTQVYSLAGEAERTRTVDAFVDRLVDEHGVVFDDAEAWAELGITDVDDVVGWIKLEVDPSEAAASVGSGYSSADVGPWLETDLAYDPDEAVPWLQSGMSVEEALSWCAALSASDPHEIKATVAIWKEHGFDRSATQQWASTGLVPEAAGQWRDAGFTAADAKVFDEALIDIEDATQWRAAGFTATAALQLSSDYVDVTAAQAARAKGWGIAATLRRARGEGLDVDDESDADGDLSPEDVLASHLPELAEPYRRARAANRPLDSLFAAIDEVLPGQDVAEVRAFALGELDELYGRGAGYRVTLAFITFLERITESSEPMEARQPRWLTMNIVDLAEEIGSDPCLTDLFLWSVHHDMRDDAAELVAQMVAALLANAGTARTKPGVQVKVDQALAVLNRLAEKATQSETNHQAIWCRTIADTLSQQRG